MKRNLRVGKARGSETWREEMEERQKEVKRKRYRLLGKMNTCRRWKIKRKKKI